jgi:hypothetical protein
MQSYFPSFFFLFFFIHFSRRKKEINKCCKYYTVNWTLHYWVVGRWVGVYVARARTLRFFLFLFLFVIYDSLRSSLFSVNEEEEEAEMMVV